MSDPTDQQGIEYERYEDEQTGEPLFRPRTDDQQPHPIDLGDLEAVAKRRRDAGQEVAPMLLSELIAIFAALREADKGWSATIYDEDADGVLLHDRWRSSFKGWKGWSE